MKKLLLAWCLLWPMTAFAQAPVSLFVPNSTDNPNKGVLVTADTPLPIYCISGCSGGGGGGNVTIVGPLGSQLSAASVSVAIASDAVFPLPTGAATAANQTNASQKTQIVDGSGNVIASTSNNLNVQCANCSGSGVSATDQASFTAGASLFAPSGGFFQTTATNDPLADGTQGLVQMTAQRAFFTNLRNASGAEIGVSGSELAVNCTVGCAGGSQSNASSGVATSSDNGKTNAWIYGFNGTTWDQLQVDGSKNLKVTAINGGTFAVQATQAGTWNITNISGTVSLPTGAATAAKQPAIGSAGSASSEVLTVQGITSMTPLKVDGTGGTFPISGTVTSNQGTSPWIIAGGGIAGSAATGVVTVQGIASGTAILVTGTGGTFPVTGTVTANAGTNLNTSLLALESGGNLATLAGGVSASVYQSNTKQVNGVTTLAGAGAVGTGAQRVAVGQDVTTIAGSAPGTAGSASTNVVTIQGIASMTKLLVTPDANSAVNVAQIGGTNVVNGGVAGSQSIGGTVATNVAITANPLNLGAQAVSSENAAVTTARQVQLVADLVGKLIVLPYANPENFVSGVITSAMTGTTSTSLVAAPASGLRNYITACTFSNAHATVGTDMILQDGSGGTTIWNVPAAAVYGGAHITFPTPLKQPTTATALYVQNVTTGASTKAACSGYKGA